MDKFKRMVRALPSFYAPEVNTMIRGLLKTWGLSDDEVTLQIGNTKDQIFEKTAEGRFLDFLGNNVGVDRSPGLGIEDEDFRQLVPVLSFFPKQVRATIIALLDAFWGPTFTRSNLNTQNVATFDFGPEIAVTGTANFVKGRSIVKGTGTNFLADVAPGDYIKPSAVSGTQYAKVSSVLDNETIQLSSSWDNATVVGTTMQIGPIRTLTYIVDGRITKTLRFKPSAFDDLTAITIEELVTFINSDLEHNDLITGSEFIDPILGSKLNLRTTTPGLQGSIQIVGGDANDPTRLNFDLDLHRDIRANVLELNPNEVVVIIPSSVPVLRRTLRGSSHPRETKTRLFSSNTEVFDFSSITDPDLDIDINGTPNTVDFFTLGTFLNTNSLSFDGVAGSTVTVPFNASDFGQLNNISAFTWFNTSSINSPFGVMFSTSRSSPLQRKWSIAMANQEIIISVSNSGSDDKLYTSVANFDDGAWHQFGFTFNSNVLRVYVDGVELTVGGGTLVKTSDLTVNTLFNNTQPLNIGNFGNLGAPFPFNGLIDEPTYWDKALTSLEVTELYNSGTVFDYTTHSASANLKELWRVDGDTLPTITGIVNSNNGTAVGGVTISTTAPPGGLVNVSVFADPARVTSTEVAQVINNELIGLDALAKHIEGYKAVGLETTNGNTNYQVTGGTANSVLGFDLSLQTDPPILLPSASGTQIGAFIFDPNGQLYTVTQKRSTISATIPSGVISPSIAITDASDFPNEPGQFILNFGRANQEGPIDYNSRPNNASLLIDASYTFEKEHLSGSTINFVVDKPTIPRVTGIDFPVFITGTEQARIAAQELIRRLLAAGVVVRFVINFPEFLFECVCRGCDPDESPDHRGSLTGQGPLVF